MYIIGFQLFYEFVDTFGVLWRLGNHFDSSNYNLPIFTPLHAVVSLSE